MGEYKKTYDRIADLLRRKKAAEQKMDELRETLQDIEEELADLDAYLLELDAIDNTDPNERGKITRF